MNAEWMCGGCSGPGTALTGMFYINVTPDGERTFFGSRGANELIANAAAVAGVAAKCSGRASGGPRLSEFRTDESREANVGVDPRAWRLGFAGRGHGAEQAIPRKILQMAGEWIFSS